MSRSKTFLSMALLISVIFAIPHPATHQFMKRGQPHIDPTVTPQQRARLLPRAGVPASGGFSNALELMNYAVTTGSDVIFAKYFEPALRETVNAVFSRLLGDDLESGAAALDNINVVNAATPGAPPGELINYDHPNPTMLLSDDAYVYPDRDSNPDACAEWNRRGLNLDMYLLGSVILHEYTHWDWFIGSIHGGEVIDQPNGYGPEGARNLDKALALYNADSYGWWATENFWGVICGRGQGWDLEDDPDKPTKKGSPKANSTAMAF